MSWFDRVTGSNEYERQSWRDSYNGGVAAGDWTGNTNARITEERESFQGTTWSGSSTQPSALELAQSMVGSGPAVGVVGGGSGATGDGPGNGTVGHSAAPTGGAGRQVVMTGGPLRAVFKDEITQIMLGGDWYKPNPYFSDANEVENRLGDAEFLSPGWFANWSIALGDGVNVATGGRLGDLQPDTKARMERPGAGAAVWDAFQAWQDQAVSARMGADGFVWKTGGGF